MTHELTSLERIEISTIAGAMISSQDLVGRASSNLTNDSRSYPFVNRGMTRIEKRSLTIS